MAAREAEAAAREAEEVRRAEFKEKSALPRSMMSESETGLLAAAGRRHERSGRSGTLRSPVSPASSSMPWKTKALEDERMRKRCGRCWTLTCICRCIRFLTLERPLELLRNVLRLKVLPAHPLTLYDSCFDRARQTRVEKNTLWSKSQLCVKRL